VKENSEKGSVGGGKTQPEKLVVAFVPDYPSKIVHPGMLANTTHFIMFYASWCSHSDAALPHFKDTLQHVVDQNITGLHLGKIEINKNPGIVKNFKIRSTPTFIMYHRGARYVYSGELSSRHLVDFLHRVMAINLAEVSSVRELSEVQRDHPVVFLVVYDGQTDPDWHHTYSTVAQERGLLAKFVFTTKTDLVQDLNVTKFPTLLVMKDGGAHKFSDSLSTHNIGKWVSRERHPAFPKVNEETFRPFTDLVLGCKLVVLLVHDDLNQQRITEKRLIDTVRRVAESRKVFPQYQFVQLTSVPLAERILQSPVPEVPSLFIYDPLTGQYYPFQSGDDGKGVTEEGIKDFCNAVRRGKIEALGGGRSVWTVFGSWWTRLHTIYQVYMYTCLITRPSFNPNPA
jgi:thiol-disulfide isomerase/thioredoxin